MVSLLCEYGGVALNPRDARSSGHSEGTTEPLHQITSWLELHLRPGWRPGASAGEKEWCWTGPQPAGKISQASVYLHLSTVTPSL